MINGCVLTGSYCSGALQVHFAVIVTVIPAATVAANMQIWASQLQSQIRYMLIFMMPAISNSVTRAGVTRSGNRGCHPIYFLMKNWRPLLPFFSSLSLSLISLVGVTPWRVSPRTFFTCPTSFIHYFFCKFAHNFFLRMSTPGGCTRGGPLPPPQWRHWRLVITISDIAAQLLIHSTVQQSPRSLPRPPQSQRVLAVNLINNKRII